MEMGGLSPSVAKRNRERRPDDPYPADENVSFANQGVGIGPFFIL